MAAQESTNSSLLTDGKSTVVPAHHEVANDSNSAAENLRAAVEAIANINLALIKSRLS